MIFEVGSILLVRNYKLPGKIKDKFFIVLGITDTQITLMSMTTSQVYFDESLIKHGVIKDRDLSLYCFEKNRIIGKNGFYFHKNTFISQRSNIFIFNMEKINSLTIEYMDCLTKEETINLIYCFYKHPGVSQKYKEVFANILTEFTQ